MTDGGAPYSKLPSNRRITYQRRMKYCTRTTCAPCRSGTPNHGPYWYASWREGGRVRSLYLGKQTPPGYAVSHTTQDAAVLASMRPPQQPALRVQTFGHLIVWRGAELVPDNRWNRKKASALFGILVNQPTCRLHREQLCELLWPGVATEVAEARLWSTLRQLRDILDIPGAEGSHLSWSGDQLLLTPGGDSDPTEAWVDAREFDRLVTLALAGEDVGICRRAIERYGESGDYLPQFAYEDWAVRRREQLRGRFVAVLLHGATLAQDREGVPEEAERYLRRVLEMESCHELAACGLMTLLRVQGRSVEGLGVYTRLERSLEELGVEAESETKCIRDQLEEALQAPVARAVLPPRPESAARTNLLSPISSFVGRDREQATIRELLRTSRLVTLTGIGGVGKTRLALAVADSQVNTYRDGVWLVELAALPSGVLCQAVARALGILEKVGEPLRRTLTEFLQPRELLLVLDTCEHIICECAELVDALLAACPQLTVLATSREPLDTTGETAWVVPPLTKPGANQAHAGDLLHSESVQLFLTRAQAKRQDFRLTPSNAAAVADVCRNLDGIPLSLELAAARLTMLSVEQIAARLGDRFSLLTGGSRAAPPRHQTLRATLHWSYALLDEPERVLLRRLSVFAGGCDLNAIEAVCTGGGIETDATMDLVGSLVNKSLVLATTGEGQARYRLLDTVRQYGQEHLAYWDEEEAIRARHCEWYVSLAEQAKPQLRSAEQALWLDRLEVEHNNLRAALEWSIAHSGAGDGNGEYGLRLASAIWQFWYMRVYVIEGRSWLERVLAGGDGGAASLRADALNGAGCLALLQVDEAQAEMLLEESLRCARRTGDRAAEARALTNLASVAAGQGDYKKALSRYEASVPIFRERDALTNAGTALYNIGITRLNLGNDEDAQPFLEDGLELFRSTGYELGIAMVLTNLATIMRQRGDLERATMTVEESASHLLESGDRSYKAQLLLETGAVEEAHGNCPTALGHFREALQLKHDSRDERGCREAMEEVAWVSAVAVADDGAADDAECAVPGQDPAMQQAGYCTGLSTSMQRRQALEHAAHLLAASDGQVTGSRLPRHPRQKAEYDTRVQVLRVALGDDEFTRCWTTGQRLTREAALSLALNGVPR